MSDLLIPMFFAFLLFYVLKRYFWAGKRRVTVLVLGNWWSRMMMSIEVTIMMIHVAMTMRVNIMMMKITMTVTMTTRRR